MSEVSYYTPEGLKKLKEELLQLEQVERPRVTQEIADARDKGDLSENAEYHAAKEEPRCRGIDSGKDWPDLRRQCGFDDGDERLAADLFQGHARRQRASL